MATANHYWLDIAAGIVIAVLTALALRQVRTLRLRRA
jgi:membrane-associated phospholipid phosphatase